MTRICTKCKIEKPLDQFGKRKHSKDGIRHECRECSRAGRKRWYEKHRESYCEKQKEKRRQNPEKYRAAELKWYSANHEKKADVSNEWYHQNKERVRDLQLKRRYGIGVVEYNKMLEDQDFRCAVCRAPQGEYKRRFCVDHDHETGKVRGLLCTICNVKICGVIDLRAKSKHVKLSNVEYVEKLLAYYKKAAS